MSPSRPVVAFMGPEVTEADIKKERDKIGRFLTIKETQGKAAIIRESRILKRQSEMDKRYREFELRKKADRKIELENA